MSEQVRYAVGYVRISDDNKQGNNHSPQVQREAITRLAAQEGYVLSLIEEDHERGAKLTRAGYQRILQAARSGEIGAVIVYMFDRWGRDAGEWLSRARELRRLGVPLISVTQGRAEGGLVSAVHAGMAEEYAMQLAKRVLPARRAGALQGTHMGPTPFGYRRVAPAWNGHGKRPPADLVIDEATAWIVREVFARYTSGGWSCLRLARWLNDDPRVPPAPRGGPWSQNAVRGLLRNSVYAGYVTFGQRPQGLYEQSAPGETLRVRGRHEALVDEAIFARVGEQMGRAAARPSATRPAGAYDVSYVAGPRAGQRVAHRVFLASGLLVCAGCGGPMRPMANRGRYGEHAGYVCQHRACGRRAPSDCRSPGYRMDLAHEALLAEVRRLQGHPWTPETTARLSGEAGSKAREAARLRQALASERSRLERHARTLTLLGEPGPEEIAAFRQVSTEIAARIAGLEEQVAQIGRVPERLPALRALHRRVSALNLATVPDGLDYAHDPEDLAAVRGLLLGLVQAARVVERVPALRSTWLRLEVTWTEGVQTLLDAGALTLAEPVPAPALHVCDGRKSATGGRAGATKV